MARREIGVLASSKPTGRTHRIIAPAEREKLLRYGRRTTDYSLLDNIGNCQGCFCFKTVSMNLQVVLHFSFSFFRSWSQDK